MEFSNTGGMRSPFSPRVKSVAGRRPIGLNSSKKNQSLLQSTEQQSGDVIYKSPSMTIETYGAPLPVMVTETLAFASGDVSVRMSPCGWCWLVAGRRILAWPRETSTPGVPTAARELTLPQTDLAHKADLVMLFYEDDAQMPSCVGVSPEGVVRYWASVGVEGTYSDSVCELAGQECERLVLARPSMLLLATTTCTLVRITTSRDGRAGARCQVLRPAGGWLGGIGRRVSLLFFGNMPAHPDTQKLVGVVVLEGVTDLPPVSAEEAEECGNEVVALVASGPVLQLWRGSHVQEHQLRRPLTEALARAHLAQGDLSSLELTALDVHAYGPSALLLLVAIGSRTPDTRLALAHISIEGADARVTSLCPLRAPVPREDEPPRCLPLSAAPLLYCSSYVSLSTPPSGGGESEVIEVRGEGDRILGAALVAAAPLLFSRKHGVLLLRPHLRTHKTVIDSPLDSPCPSDMYEGNLSLYEIDPHEVSALATDLCGRLKTAFLFHVRRDPAVGRALAELLPRADTDVDAAIDRAVLSVAEDMLDDVPAGDPRWRVRGSAVRVALGSSAALQASAQLRDKQRAFSLFLDFLRAHGILRRFGKITRDDGSTECTLSALCGLGARLAGMRALQRRHAAGAPLLDAALQASAADDAEDDPELSEALASGALSAADVCWRRVTRLPQLLAALARLPPSADPRAAALNAQQALDILANVMSEMHSWAGQWTAWAGPVPRPAPSLGAHALLPALIQLHTRAVTQCARNCPDAALRAQVLEGAAALADLALVEAEPLRIGARTGRLYEKMRNDILQPYVDEGQIERALVLAEKFRHLQLLVDVCVERDLPRLYAYIDKFLEEGMAEIAFDRLLSAGGPKAALAIRELGERQSARLSAWLSARSDRGLLALHQLSRIRDRTTDAAARSLANAAAHERSSLRRLRTLASLSKLCTLAGDDDPTSAETRRQVEERLTLAELHDAMPRELRAHHGISDTEDCRVLDPEELVQMYIDAPMPLNELDYKQALDLTELVPDMERRDELRLRVWCACIRQDDWSSPQMDAPDRELSQKIFFRLVDLVHIMGGDLELLLPPVEDILTAPELAELVSDPRFHYLLKYGYECVDTDRDMQE
ncbi:nuclear pore complex protein Nup133 isoform X3 [Aricia agestis]|uniref:nuclear pore complex protein Nup133 isoform X3 n=1 Tax=Aricia agestis TaxID=91739 RepID=UPI001C202542|nr:nuclear pore complex protein Nup133 isoform X3 [Aricia agestis]